jgi:predicted MFS family arabinose efflux permease
MIVAVQTAVLTYAPGRTDIATAWFSAAFNVGIAAGPLIGGLALTNLGLRSTALAGAVLATAALLAALNLRSGRIGPPASPEPV